MLVFSMSFGANTNLKFAVPNRDTEFCEKYFKTMLPEDTWSVMLNNYRRYDKDEDKEGFERVWGFLQTQLKEFTLPKPDDILVSKKCF